VVKGFLIGCIGLIVIGCAGVRSEDPEEQQGHTEGSNKDQTSSLEATASEQARCEGTRTTVRQGFHRRREDFLTNDLPGCPKGGLLPGTDGSDNLDGKEGDDEIRGLGERDFLFGGPANDVVYGGPGSDWWLFGGAGNDVIYGGPGDDSALVGDDGPSPGDDVIYGGSGDEEEIYGGNGDDVVYGGDGNDYIGEKRDRGHDKLYCGDGKDTYEADKNDFVSSSCEKKMKWGPGIP
jgi:hemolysin type calcium-binding protein